MWLLNQTQNWTAQPPTPPRPPQTFMADLFDVHCSSRPAGECYLDNHPQGGSKRKSIHYRYRVTIQIKVMHWCIYSLKHDSDLIQHCDIWEVRIYCARWSKAWLASDVEMWNSSIQEISFWLNCSLLLLLIVFDSYCHPSTKHTSVQFDGGTPRQSPPHKLRFSFKD